MSDFSAISAIYGYHAHIYYHDEDERGRAAVIREGIESAFEVRMGSWRDEPVGPHSVAMFQVAFSIEVFAEIVPWLMLNHAGLSVLIHPETGDHVPDHRDFPIWLGEKLALNVSFLEAGNTRA